METGNDEGGVLSGIGGGNLERLDLGGKGSLFSEGRLLGAKVADVSAGMFMRRAEEIGREAQRKNWGESGESIRTADNDNKIYNLFGRVTI
jgi:hypothetical protein